ncbi:MAG: Ig-like domain-containing protein, partial [Pseudomonadota bacterium]
GTLAIVVEEVIDAAPVVDNDSLTLAFAGRFDSAAADVLDSGSTALGGVLTDDRNLLVEIEKMPEHGVLKLHADNTFSYIHNGTAMLTDRFIYRVVNEDGIFTTASITINVEPPIAEAIAVIPPVVTVPEPADSGGASEQNEEPAVEKATVDEPTAAELFEPVAFGVSPIDQARTETDEQEPVVVTLDPVLSTNALIDVVSKKIEVKQHASVDRPIALTTETSTIASVLEIALAFGEERFGIANTDFLQGLLKLESNLQEAGDDSKRRVQLTNEAMFGVTVSATAGIVAWVLRGGALFASVMALTPYWTTLDPSRLINNRKDNSEDVEHFFESR